jgi:hypothetical protein
MAFIVKGISKGVIVTTSMLVIIIIIITIQLT